MAEGWAGERGAFWAQNAGWFSRMLGDYIPPLLDGANLRAGERVLDVGSGGGDLSIAAGQAVGPEGSVVGVDLSADEIAVALQRVADAGLANVEFEVGDASAVQLSPPFDVLVSRFGVMFFDDPVAAFTNLHGLLATDGRLAFVAWTRPDDNAWLTVNRDAIASVVDLPAPQAPDAPGPYAFADGDRVRQLLGDAGFGDIRLDQVEAAVDLGDDLDRAVEFARTMEYAKAALDHHPQDVQDRALAAMRSALAEHVGPDGIRLPGFVWLVRASA